MRFSPMIMGKLWGLVFLFYFAYNANIMDRKRSVKGFMESDGANIGAKSPVFEHGGKATSLTPEQKGAFESGLERFAALYRKLAE